MTQMSLSTSSNLDSDLSLLTYTEAVDGDISNDPENPSELLLSPGTTILSASTGNEDLEYLTVIIPDGFQLDSLVLESISPERNVAFVAVQEGDQFTEPLNRETTEIGNLLGYNLFGEPRQIGTDILDDIGDGFGAIGFEGALPNGEYTFVFRQAGVVSDYTLAFNVAEATEPEEDSYVYEGWDDYTFEWSHSRLDTDNADPIAGINSENDVIVGGENTQQLQMNSAQLSEESVDLAELGMGFQDVASTLLDGSDSMASNSDLALFPNDVVNSGDFAFG
ncbi:MAG: hypothetical protein ACFB4I_04470 [Cyanophyceae cyanobacterium]